MAKKPKWLESATTNELLEMLGELISEGMEKKDATKAKKIVQELIERAPSDDEDLTLVERLESFQDMVTSGVSLICEAYKEELEAIEEDEEDEEDTDDDEEDDEDEEDEEDEEEMDYSEMGLKELKAECKERDIKVPAKAKKKQLIALLEEDDEAGEDEEDEEEDYTEWDKSELIEECKERGIKLKSKAKKSDMIKLLEADDKE